MIILKNKWNFIPFSYHDGPMNMALDSVLFDKRINGKISNTVRFYGWNPPTVSIGKHQDLETEVNVDLVEKLGFNIVRRITGGGAVFHHDELTYSVVMSVDDLVSKNVDESFIEISHGIVNGLAQFNIDLIHDKIHCPSIFTKKGKKKISGNAQSRKKDFLLQHGTILLDYDPDLMYSLLRVKEGKTKAKMVKSVYQHVTTVKEEICQKILPETIFRSIAEGFARNLNTTVQWRNFTQEEIKNAAQIVENKFAEPQWLNRH